jgi:hypothetical protein
MRFIPTLTDGMHFSHGYDESGASASELIQASELVFMDVD